MADIFISYRRDGGEHLAARLAERLKSDGYKVSFDVESLRSGDFNDAIFREIDSCKDVIVVLPPNALDRCSSEDDWVRRELEYAHKSGKVIIPVMMRGFEWPSDNALPETLKWLPRMNGVSAKDNDLFEGTVSKLKTKLLTSSPHGFAKLGKKSMKYAVMAVAFLVLVVGIFCSIQWGTVDAESFENQVADSYVDENGEVTNQPAYSGFDSSTFMNQVEDNIRTNPTFGDAVAMAVCESLGGEEQAKEHYPWLVEFLSKTEEAFSDKRLLPYGYDYWKEYYGGNSDSTPVSEEYYVYAVKLIGLLESMQIDGVKNCCPRLTWIADDSPSKDQERIFVLENTGNANKPALVFQTPSPYGSIGFSIDDLEIYSYREPFEILQSARIEGGDSGDWSKSIIARQGDVIEFQIAFINTSEEMESDVMVRDIIPSGLEFIEGSAQLWNTNHLDGATFNDGTLQALLDGHNIGGYKSGSNAFVRFRAMVSESTASQGQELANWSQACMNDITYQDVVYINVETPE